MITMARTLPKISIVTVTYNCAPVLEATLQSIFAQDYPNFECVLIDGGSTDGTLDTIQKHARHIAYWKSEPDKGIFDAMGKSLHAITGEWVCFMNAGDMFASSRVLTAIFAQDTSPIPPEVACIHGQTWEIHPKKRIREKSHPFYKNRNPFRPMGFCHQAAFVRTEWARRTGFDLSYKIAADYQMLYTIYEKGGLFKETEVDVALIDVSGVSAQNRTLQYKEVARICGCSNNPRFWLWLGYKRLRAQAKKALQGISKSAWTCL